MQCMGVFADPFAVARPRGRPRVGGAVAQRRARGHHPRPRLERPGGGRPPRTGPRGGAWLGQSRPIGVGYLRHPRYQNLETRCQF